MAKGREKKFTVAQMHEALDSSKGMIYLTAARLGCVKSTVHNYINLYPELRDCVDSHRGKLVDIAESKLYEKVCDGDWNAIRFVLDRLGKDRGYGEEVKVEMKYGTIKVPATAEPQNWMEVVKQEIAHVHSSNGNTKNSMGSE